MRIAFLSEGATEAAFAPGASDEESWPRAGALVILVGRILDVRGRIEPWVPASGLGAGSGAILHRGRALLRAGARAGAKGAVMLVDADTKGNQRLATLRGDREAVLAEKPLLAIPTAIGVAVEKFESWLLGDEICLCRVLKLPNPPEPMGDPEDLKGKRGAADDAKAKLNEYLSKDRFGPRPFLEQVRAIATQMDLDLVARRCRSFQQFRDEVRGQLGSLFSA
jgi:hypothetical protein